jgi:DNA-binding transcriptional MerR regulator
MISNITDVRMSELSAASGVSIPTIKYYIRTGLLPAGTPLVRNQHRYGEQHVRRLELVRALTGVAGLSVAEVCDVIGADAEGMARAADAVGMDRGDVGELADDEELAEARAAIEQAARERGWRVLEGSLAQDRAALAFALLGRLGSADPTAGLKRYADAAAALAHAEASDRRATASPAGLLVDALLGEVLLAALCRLARVSAL